MAASGSAAAPVHVAVTAVLQHEDHILMVRRNPALSAFPGYWVFPGGKVDPEDAVAAPRADAWCAGHEPHFIEALARELREEVGLDLDHLARRGEVADLHYFGTALTPAIVPRRFDTRFFRLRLRQRPSIRLDSGEVVDARWARPDRLRADYRDGRLLLAPPTVATLDLFARAADTRGAPVELESLHAQRIPLIESVHGLRHLSVRSNTLPPAQHTNCFLIGDEAGARVLVDPAPGDDAEFEALLARVRDLGIGEILLTHHHPDHRERANRLAVQLGVGMAMSADCAARIAACEPDYFAGLATPRMLEEGEVVCRWLDRPVRVLAVPGHDEGQIALMPDDRAWCIVGDLIQGVGTVVIHPPEGDMRRYFESLERLIALDPAVILPSHGMAMGTTYRLRETLRHRQQREAQVLGLHRQGRSADDMLAAIYGELDARLLPLARHNIVAHLDKLRADGLLD